MRISSFTVGSRNSERTTPFVCPQRAALMAYQRWAWKFFGPSSTARRPASRPRS
jgi:hypothetical protein